jgi:hypothetical protein
MFNTLQVLIGGTRAGTLTNSTWSSSMEKESYRATKPRTPAPPQPFRGVIMQSETQNARQTRANGDQSSCSNANSGNSQTQRQLSTEEVRNGSLTSQFPHFHVVHRKLCRFIHVLNHHSYQTILFIVLKRAQTSRGHAKFEASSGRHGETSTAAMAVIPATS